MRKVVMDVDDEQNVKLSKIKDERSLNCPYLDTINRNLLDFDFEKLCSVTLSHINVYACLVCGKYFQGRSKKTYAYIHSVELSHHVWINLSTLKFYCLPDNYEIICASLSDIKNVINPKFDLKTIKLLDSNNKMYRAIDGMMYYPSIVGMNNIRETDYINVVLHIFMFVKPVRNVFIREKNYKDLLVSGDIKYELIVRFGELVRKVWNNAAFKTHVSPHEMIQCIINVSNKKFSMDKQSDPIEFLSWFLNNMHVLLSKSDKNHSSIINKAFKGMLKVYSRKIPLVDEPQEKKLLSEKAEYQPTENFQPFYYLSLDLPPPPLFTDAIEFSIIPQIPITDLLAKYNGSQEKEYKTYKDFYIKRFIITKLPRFLIFHIKRFTRNYFFKEKYQTVINFDFKFLDMRDYIHPNYMSKNKHFIYKLIANVFVQTEPGNVNKMIFSIQVLHKPTSKWFQIRDLQVTEIMPPMISLTESYIQIWEQQRNNL